MELTLVFDINTSLCLIVEAVEAYGGTITEYHLQENPAPDNVDDCHALTVRFKDGNENEIDNIEEYVALHTPRVK